MSEKFPILKGSQVALSRADRNTGTVLDETFRYASTPVQTVYTIYDNLVDAVNAAKLIIADKPTVECYIHDKNEALLHFFDEDNCKE